MSFIPCELLFHSCDGHIVVAAMPKSSFICHVNSGPKVTVDRFLGVLQVRPFWLPSFPLPDASPSATVGDRRLLEARRFFSSRTAANDVHADSIAGCALCTACACCAIVLPFIALAGCAKRRRMTPFRNYVQGSSFTRGRLQNKRHCCSGLFHGARSRSALMSFSKGLVDLCFYVDTPNEILVAAAVELQKICDMWNMDAGNRSWQRLRQTAFHFII